MVILVLDYWEEKVGEDSEEPTDYLEYQVGLYMENWYPFQVFRTDLQIATLIVDLQVCEVLKQHLRLITLIPIVVVQNQVLLWVLRITSNRILPAHLSLALSIEGFIFPVRRLSADRRHFIQSLMLNLLLIVLIAVHSIQEATHPALLRCLLKQLALLSLQCLP